MSVHHPGKLRGRFAQGNSAKMTLCSVAFLLLTGAEGDSCLPGGETEPVPEPPPAEVCPPGSHLETLCDGGGYGAHDPGFDPNCGYVDDGNTGSDCIDPNTGLPGDCACGGGGGDCHDICVPDEVCPPGTYEEWICEDPAQPRCFCDMPEGCEPVPGQCYPLCVPIEPCGPDMHEELVCFGPPEPMPDVCLDPNGCELPPPPEDQCELMCVPNDICGPGMHEEWICEPPPPPDGPCLDPDGCLPPDPGQESCYPTCVPDGPCPPGTEAIITCDEQLGACWAECIPTEPCPPDMYPEQYCDQWGCFIQCVPAQPCPPDMFPVEHCDPNGCWIECLPL